MKKIPVLLLLGLIGLLHNAAGQPALPHPGNSGDSIIDALENKLSGPAQDTSAYVNDCCRLSRLYNNQSRYVKSKKILYKALVLILNNKSRGLSGKIHMQLGNTYKLERDVAVALDYYLKALKDFESAHDVAGRVELYAYLAEYYRSLGQYTSAREYIRAALSMYQQSKLNDVPKLIRIYNRWAAIENESDHKDSSLFYSLKAIELSRKTGNLNAEATSLNEIGFTMKNKFMVDSSLKCYKRAIELWTATHSDMDLVHGIWNLAILMSHNEKRFPKQEVMPYYQKIINIVNEKKLDYPLDQVYFEYSNCYFFMGDSLACFKMRQVYFEALLTRMKKEYNTEVNNIKERYENDEYKTKISKASEELKQYEIDLEKKKKENFYIYLFSAILLALLIIIALLARRISITNRILKEKNKEKDSLIQEIHHRVKNNLQYISALLEMHMNDHEEDNQLLQNASRRIASMALVHEMLYSNDINQAVNLKSYIDALVNYLYSNSQGIRYDVAIEDTQLNVSQCISIGMILSELISNSNKYAFANVADPLIRIRIAHQGDNNLEFSYQDNGSGFSDRDKIKKGLGSRLIDIFSRQLKGTYTINGAGGFNYNLKFTI